MVVPPRVRAASGLRLDTAAGDRDRSRCVIYRGFRPALSSWPWWRSCAKHDRILRHEPLRRTSSSSAAAPTARAPRFTWPAWARRTSACWSAATWRPGATGKSGALVRMHYTNEHESRLAIESLKIFREFSTHRRRRLRLRGAGLPPGRGPRLRGRRCAATWPASSASASDTREISRDDIRAALPRVPRRRHRRRGLGARLRLRRSERHRVRLRGRRAAPGRHHRDWLSRHPHPDRARPRHRRGDRGRARRGAGGRAGARRLGPAAARSARTRLWAPALPHPGLALPLAARADPQAPGGHRRGPEGVDPAGGRQSDADRRRAGRAPTAGPRQATRGRGRGLRGALPRAAVPPPAPLRRFDDARRLGRHDHDEPRRPPDHRPDPVDPRPLRDARRLRHVVQDLARDRQVPRRVDPRGQAAHGRPHALPRRPLRRGPPLGRRATTTAASA